MSKKTHVALRPSDSPLASAGAASKATPTRGSESDVPVRVWMRRAVVAGLLLFPGSSLSAACTPDSQKNYEHRAGLEGERLDPGCIDECRHVSAGEPTPPLVDCQAAQEGLEFYPLPIWDFDSGLSSNMYTYTDNTSEFLDPNGWEPETELVQRCQDGDPVNRALHIRGGPFIEWGGGIGRGLKCLNYSPILGRLKLDELGVAPADYEGYGNVGVTSTSVCESGADCEAGLECVDEGRFSRCRPPVCESNQDCESPGWYCPPPPADDETERRCQTYVPERSCGEAPRWKIPELGREFSGEMEGACGGADSSSISGLNDEQRETYEEYREIIEAACPDRDQRAIERGSPDGSGEDEFLLGMALDFSEWDGISFWARRSIDSQPGIRLAVGDKFTDEDLNYLQVHVNPEDEPYCRRNRECNLRIGEPDRCTDGRPCVRMIDADEGEVPDVQNPQECESGALIDGRCAPARRCIDPERDLIPPNWSCSRVEGEWVCEQSSVDFSVPWHTRCSDDCTGLDNCVAPEDCPEEHPCSTYDFADPNDPDAEDERFCWNPIFDPVPYDAEIRFDACGDFACDQFYRPFQRNDAQFRGLSCNEYALEGGITRSFCYDPEEGPEPAEGLEACGDHWLTPVLLSEEWRFFTIPFEDLLQQGWAKEAHQFDLTSLSVVRFTWNRGWVDYWIDDVRVYRHERD